MAICLQGNERSYSGSLLIYKVTTAMTMIAHAFRTLTFLQLYTTQLTPHGAVKDFVRGELVQIYSFWPTGTDSINIVEQHVLYT